MNAPHRIFSRAKFGMQFVLLLLISMWKNVKLTPTHMLFTQNECAQKEQKDLLFKIKYNLESGNGAKRNGNSITMSANNCVHLHGPRKSIK
jgi:hypothetical protein